MQDNLQKQQKTLFLIHKIISFKQKPLLSNNIFETHDPYNGPKYDKNNKIIARSVVGKPDIIEKVKRRIEESKLSNSPQMKNSIIYQKMKQSYSNLSNMKKTQSSSKYLFNDAVNSNQLSRQVSHNKSSMVSLINNHTNVNIEQYLQETQKRIQRNQIDEQKQQEKQLNIFLKNANTRQQRVITSFQEREESWELLNMTIQSKCKTRSKERLTLLQKSQAYRLKKQILNELPCPPKNWYQELRGSNSTFEKEVDCFNNTQRINLNSKTLLIKNTDLENSLRVRGESKLKKEFENKKCSMITMFGQEKTEESEFMTKQLF